MSDCPPAARRPARGDETRIVAEIVAPAGAGAAQEPEDGESRSPNKKSSYGFRRLGSSRSPNGSAQERGRRKPLLRPRGPRPPAPGPRAETSDESLRRETPSDDRRDATGWNSYALDRGGADPMAFHAFRRACRYYSLSLPFAAEFYISRKKVVYTTF